MKLILITLLLLLMLSIWAIAFPSSKVTIRAGDVRKLGNHFYEMVKTWANNRLQTHRLRQSLVQREIMLAHSQQLTMLSSNSELYEMTAKSFKKIVIFQRHQKTTIIIPTGSLAITDFAKKELDSCLLELLMTYYPNHHWQQLASQRVPLTNYFYLVIKQK